MREIKFRGITKSGKCVYGTGVFFDGINTWLLSNEEDRAIAFGLTHNIVNKDTLGQFTSKLDKNKEEIYAGDKIQDETGFIVSVEWNDTLLTFQCFGKHRSYRPLLCDLSMNLWQKIGNIHEGES